MSGAPASRGDLDAVRAAFDDVDAKIVALLAERAALARAAGAVKRAAGLPIVDLAREDVARAARRAQATALGLDATVVDDVFAVLVRHARRLQGAE